MLDLQTLQTHSDSNRADFFSQPVSSPPTLLKVLQGSEQATIQGNPSSRNGGVARKPGAGGFAALEKRYKDRVGLYQGGLKI